MNKYLKTLIIVLLLGMTDTIFAQASYAPAPQYQLQENTVPIFTNNDIISRLQETTLCINPRFTDVVKGYVTTYTIKNRHKTEQMLGRIAMYFPLYEK